MSLTVSMLALIISFATESVHENTFGIGGYDH